MIFSTILDYSSAAYKIISFSRMVSGGEGENSCAFGIGFSPTPVHQELPPPSNSPNPIPTAHEIPSPIGPGTSPPLTSLMLN